MGDWQELGQSVFIGLIFSFLVAKLISVVFSFREDNLKIVRQEDLPPEAQPNLTSLEPVNEPIKPELGVASSSSEGIKQQQESELDLSRSYLGEDEDDWEGVESTELDEAFSAATTFVAAAASDRLAQKVSNEVQLHLYGLYKIATEGPCNTPQPSALKMSARAKWNAWQRLGALPTEEAMQKYIAIVTELYPTWAAGSTSKSKDGSDNSTSSASHGPMGPVFSSFVYEETDNDLRLDAIHAAAREGESDNLLKYINSGVSVNVKDSEGRTALHWAVDRGHLDVVQLLVSNKADVNNMDNEGQTPLHYAAMCEREAIAKVLVNQDADTGLKDNDGNSPCDLCESNWPWMQHKGKSVE